MMHFGGIRRFRPHFTLEDLIMIHLVIDSISDIGPAFGPEINDDFKIGPCESDFSKI